MHHEELESLVKNYPTIKRARFWMTFGQQYLTYLDCIQNLGMSRIDPVTYEAPLHDDPTKTVKVDIVPLQFLKAVLPNPQDLGANYDGETSIGCRIRGIKDGKEHTYYIFNNCRHQDAYEEAGMQGVSYTTGVPAMAGAMMFFKGLWRKPEYGMLRTSTRIHSSTCSTSRDCHGTSCATSTWSSKHVGELLCALLVEHNVALRRSPPTPSINNHNQHASSLRPKTSNNGKERRN